jgi:hypothetical protein
MTASTTRPPGRNEPCHCGSGRKYKQCCLPKDEAKAAKVRAKAAKEAEAAAAAAAAEPSEETEAAEAAEVKSTRPPKHETQQPWKASTSRGFVSRSRTPRKVGGS